MVCAPDNVMSAVVPATTEALVSKPCATVSTYDLFAMSVDPDGVVEIVPVVNVTDVMSVLAPEAAAVKFVLAPAAVVAPVPPLATANVPATVTMPVVDVAGVRPVEPKEMELTPAPLTIEPHAPLA